MTRPQLSVISYQLFSRILWTSAVTLVAILYYVMAYAYHLNKMETRVWHRIRLVRVTNLMTRIYGGQSVSVVEVDLSIIPLMFCTHKSLSSPEE